MSEQYNIQTQRLAQRLADPLLPWLLGKYTESGTWTPTIVGATTPGTLGYGVASGRYYRTGPLVYVECQLSVSAISVAPTGAIRIAGLPAAYLPDGANTLTVGMDGAVALTAGRLGLAASVIAEGGQAYISLSEVGNNAAASGYTPALLAASGSFALTVSGRYLAVDAATTGGGPALDLRTDPGTLTAIVISTI